MTIRATNNKHETLGLWLSVLGVCIFAVTLPMTRLATGTVDAPQLSPWFVTFGRAALAGALSLAFLLMTDSALPTPRQRKPLLMALLGNAIGYPLLLGFALASNLSYALVGTLLRQWLADPEHGGRRLRWFNRCMALVLLVTAAWMATI